jgi:hypothetical protein
MASKMDPDNPCFHKGISEPDSELSCEAMVIEIPALPQKTT